MEQEEIGRRRALRLAPKVVIEDRAKALGRQGADADGVGDWLGDYIFSLSGPIYAGSNEIQRNIIAERMLGLPRA